MTLFDNKKFVTEALMGIVSDEGKRVISSNLATKDQLVSLLKLSLNKAMSYGNKEDVLINTLSDLHVKLSSIKLPGDFEKNATDPFYDLSGIPELSPKSEEEKLQYQLPEKSEDDEDDEDLEEKEDVDNMQKDLEHHKEPHEDFALAGAVITMLEKIANTLAGQNKHQAAYLVERTIRNIKNGDKNA